MNEHRTGRMAGAWQELNALTVDNFGQAPTWIKALILLGILVLTMGFGYLLLIQPAMLEHQSLQSQEQALIAQYAQKYAKAQQLTSVQNQSATMNEQLALVLEQLPNTLNMAALVDDIHHAAERAGVQIEDVKMGENSETALFVMRDLNVSVRGNYHQFGQFFANLSATPTLMTVHDFELTLAENDGKPLRLNLTIKSYKANPKADNNTQGEKP